MLTAPELVHWSIQRKLGPIQESGLELPLQEHLLIPTSRVIELAA